VPLGLKRRRECSEGIAKIFPRGKAPVDDAETLLFGDSSAHSTRDSQTSFIVNDQPK
jgi:hypothetical protein